MAFAVPKDIALGLVPRMLRQALLQTGDGIGRQIYAPILAPFPLLGEQRRLRPVKMRTLERCDLRDAQPTAEHHQKQGAVHRAAAPHKSQNNA